MVKPGGILVIDRNNYDDMLSTGSIPARNIYYNVCWYSQILNLIIEMFLKISRCTEKYAMICNSARIYFNLLDYVTINLI